MIEIIILLLAFPIGYLISWMAREELVQGKKWFKILIAISFFVGIFSLIYNLREIFYTSIFMIIVAGISLRKGSKNRERKFK